MSLKKKIIKATGFIYSGYALTQIIRILGSMVTTRLLAPELYGVMALANAFSTAATMLGDAGVSLSILRHDKGHEKDFLKTTFSIKVLQGLVLAIIMVLISGILALLAKHNVFPPESVYSNPDLITATLILALVVFIRGFASVEIELHQRSLNFGKTIIIDLLCQVLSLGFVIGFAIVEPSILALALASLLAAVLNVIFSYTILPAENMGFAWNKEYVRDIFNFGKWIAGSSSLGFLSQHSDKLIFGAIMTSQQMGQYAIATLIFLALERIITKANKVWLPVFSKIGRESPDRISELYYRVRLYRDLIICCMAGVFMCSGDLIINILFDSRYSNAGWMLQILSISLFIRAFQLKGQVVTARGDSRTIMMITLQRSLGTVIVVPIAYFYFGLQGAILAFSLRFLLGTQTLYGYFYRHGFINIRKELRTFLIIGLGVGLGYLTRFPLEVVLDHSKQLKTFIGVD